LKAKKNKLWSKISLRYKFKSIIRKIVAEQRKDPKYINSRFKIFKYVDRLYEGRMARMVNLKKIMARKLVE